MSIEIVFPTKIFSKTEEDILRETFATPVVKDYLKHLAAASAKALLDFPSDSDDRSIAKAHALAQGRLQMIDSLLMLGESQEVVNSNQTQN